MFDTCEIDYLDGDYCKCRSVMCYCIQSIILYFSREDDDDNDDDDEDDGNISNRINTQMNLMKANALTYRTKLSIL